MKTAFSRLKLTLLLTLAIFLPILWIMLLSSSSLLTTMGIPKLTTFAFFVSFGTAYAITLYISAIRKSDEQQNP